MDKVLQLKKYGEPYMPVNVEQVIGLADIRLRQLTGDIVALYAAQRYPLLSLIRDLVAAYVTWTLFHRVWVFIWGHGPVRAITIIFQNLKKRFFAFVLSLPPIKKKVAAELEKTISKIQTELMKNDDALLQFPALPERGLTPDAVVSELDKLQELKHNDWAAGRVSGAVYHGGDSLLELQSQAYAKYSVANQLHPDVFPGLRKMEAEVVAMVLDIFNAPALGCGSTTLGGTESLLLAGLSAREYGRRKKGITHPEVIAPVTVHAGIEKACFYFGMKLHKVDVEPTTYKVDLRKVKRLINSNTVLLVGSAPNYPHGIIDDIEGLSELAVRYGIPLHVDACLGSFIVSFLEKANVHLKVPLFDFRVPGVTSISCDTHKYGFAPKGSSIIMYRTAELREHQYYVASDWTGGMYGSPTLAGSRPGALMAGCWATLVSIGEDGYTKSCKDIVETAMKLKLAIKWNEFLSQHLELVGDPLCSVVAFTAKNSLNIYALGDSLSAKGWHFASLQAPAALHFAVTRLTIPVIDELIQDLVSSIEELLAQPSANHGDTAALYGVAGSVSTTGVADRVIVAFLDTLFKT